MTGYKSIPLFVRGLTLLASIIVLGIFSASAQAPGKIKPGDKLEKAINGGQTLEFAFDMKRGRFARFEIEPVNLDLKIAVLDASGKTVKEVDGKTDYVWRNDVAILAESEGLFKLQVKGVAPTARTGKLSIKFLENKKPFPTDLKRIEAGDAFSLAARLSDENKLSESIAAFEQAGTIWNHLGDRYREALCHWNIAWLFHFAGKSDEAIAAHNKALTLFIEEGDKFAISSSLHGLGAVYRVRKDLVQAQKFLEEARDIRREIGNFRNELSTRSMLVIVYIDLGDREKSVENFQRLGELGVLLNEPTVTREAYNSLGRHYGRTGNPSEAKKYLEKALALDIELKDARGQIERTEALLDISGEKMRSAEYLAIFENALKGALSIKDRSLEGRAREGLGYYYRIAAEDCGRSLTFFEEAYNIAISLPKRISLDETRIISRILTATSCSTDNAKTLRYSELGYKTASEGGNQIGAVSFLQSMAMAQGNMGQIEKAKETYAKGLILAKAERMAFNQMVILSSLADLFSTTGDYKKQQELDEEALEISRKLRESSMISLLLGSLADSYAQTGNDAKAIELLDELLKNAKDEGEDEKISDAIYKKGLYLARKRDYDGALAKFQEASQISEKAGLMGQSDYIHGSIAQAYIDQGRAKEALPYLEKAYRRAVETKATAREHFAALAFGNAFLKIGDDQKAIFYLDIALTRARESRNRNSEALALYIVGGLYFRSSDYVKALKNFEEVETIAKETQSKWLLGFAKGGLGSLKSDMRQNTSAQVDYQQSLDLLTEVNDRIGQGNVLNAIGITYLHLKNYEKATEYFQKSLEIARQTNNKNGEIYPLNGLGWVYLYTNELDKARGSFEAAAGKARELNDRGNEARSLKGLGDLYLKKKDYAAAEDHLTRSLTIARQTGDRKLEAPVLQAMMELYRDTRKPAQAVFYGKLAINIYQSVRENIKGLDKASQQSYLADKEAAYRTLAGILISQGKLFAAQQVLDLLKEAEYASPTRGGDGQAIQYSGTEAEIAQNMEDLVKLEREFGELSVRNDLDDNQVARSNTLGKMLQDTNKAIREKLKSLAGAPATGETAAGIMESDSAGIREALRTYREVTGSGVVALYTVLAREDGPPAADPRNERSKFGWVILVTENGSKEYPIDVTDINNRIFKFHDALSDSSRDPKSVAEELYTAIFRQKRSPKSRTLEQDLAAHMAGYREKTLMWSLDGVLRYIPMAALHDGNNYLVERYRSSIITNRNVVNLTTPNAREWRALGLGVSEARDGFFEIPEVKTELETIVSEGSRAGIFPGAVRLNNAFRKIDLARLIRNAGKPYPIVHIASHYSFNPADPGQSFLLVGDGRITFNEMKDSGNIFSGVDILTLSACDTGVTENGKETEGLSYKAQEFGARSVIASLWKVSDKGTSELMVRFYRLLAETPGISKGEAFRKAQLSLLGSEGITGRPGADAPRGIKKVGAPGDLPPYVKDEKKPYAHPHYWSSFVLIGNWR